jgi:hypothetical protein
VSSRHAEGRDSRTPVVRWMTCTTRSKVHCDDLSGGRGKGLTPAVHRLRALDLICRLDAAATSLAPPAEQA